MREKIDILIAKKLSGNASPEEQAQLRAWLDTDPANSNYYAEAKKMWHFSGSFRSSEEGIDVDAAWNEFRALAGNHAPKKVQPRTVILRAAAAFFFLIVTTLLLTFLWPMSESQLVMSESVALHADTMIRPAADIAAGLMATDEISADSAFATVQKRTKKRRPRTAVMIAVSSEDSAMVFTLPDNTKVYLNRQSKLTYPEKFAGGQRNVYLSGEAYFETPAGNELFVYCHDTRTRSMGSSFNVKGLRDGIVEISAIKGEIEIEHKKDPTRLVRIEQGQQAVYNTASHKLAVNKVTRKDRWWKRGGFRAFMRNFFYRITHPRDSGRIENN